jgi:hypothetical protein
MKQMIEESHTSSKRLDLGGTDYFLIKAKGETQMTILDRILKLLNLERVKPTTAHVLAPTVANNGKFLQINQPGRPRNYQFICACKSGTYNYDGQSIHETYKCGSCKGEYNLVLALAGTLEVPAYELERRLDSLEITRSARQQSQQQRHQWTGDEPVRAEWGGPRDTAAREREAAFENGDPEMMGPGFSFPKR